MLENTSESDFIRIVDDGHGLSPLDREIFVSKVEASVGQGPEAVVEILVNRPSENLPGRTDLVRNVSVVRSKHDVDVRMGLHAREHEASARFEQADAGWRIGHHDLARHHCVELLARSDLPDDHREHLLLISEDIDGRRDGPIVGSVDVPRPEVLHADAS